ncbi:hypothetical protein GQ457_07G009950 [Hibiscus cannabinus]
MWRAIWRSKSTSKPESKSRFIIELSALILLGFDILCTVLAVLTEFSHILFDGLVGLFEVQKPIMTLPLIQHVVLALSLIRADRTFPSCSEDIPFELFEHREGFVELVEALEVVLKDPRELLLRDSLISDILQVLKKRKEMSSDR